ncbi:MAG: hypothetical protein E6H06_08685 [Bacteroidetes bacterium]|nr:MAG: hypothetical protein E6H06_08685 [Bacteroidota bacterium]
MRIIIFLLLISFMIKPAFSQTPSKKEMQQQMLEMSNELNIQIADLEKQIADAKKNKADEETIKELQDQLAMLKKQVAMMGGLNKQIGKVSEKTFQQANEEGKNIVPKRDATRINSLPKKILSDAELVTYVKNLVDEVEKALPAAEKTEALKIYNQTKEKYKSAAAISNAATGCWIYGHWEKALFLAGRACQDNMKDPNNLNTYASFLTMADGEQAALPILQYLDKKYPENSTILNNIGQAWFGLGDMENAKKYLKNAINSYPDHSMANLTMSTIYKSEGDTSNAIKAIKRSIKKAYTEDKDHELEKLGGKLEDDDIEFNYPMEDDPLGFDPFFNVFPSAPAGVAEAPKAWSEWNAFDEAIEDLSKKIAPDEEAAGKRAEQFMMKMANPTFNQPVLKLHKTNARNIAVRKLPLALKKKSAVTIEDVMKEVANGFHDATTNRLNALEKQREADMARITAKWAKCEGSLNKPAYCSDVNGECREREAVNDNFMKQAEAIINDGRAAMLKVYRQNKAKINQYIKLTGYGALNDYAERMQNFSKEVWQQNQWLYTYTANFTSTYKSLLDRPKMFSKCGEDLSSAPKQTKQLPGFKKPDCPHSATVKLPVGKIKEKCNTTKIDESKLKMKQDNAQQGDFEFKVGDVTVLDEDDDVHLKIGEITEITDEETSSVTNGPEKKESSDPSKTFNVECDNSGNIHININKIDSQKSGNDNNIIKSTVNSGSTGNTSSLTGFGSHLMLTR